jgi:hypothetical protein
MVEAFPRLYYKRYTITHRLIIWVFPFWWRGTGIATIGKNIGPITYLIRGKKWGKKWGKMG